MYTKPGLQTEPWNLPVGQIKDLILTCFKNLNQSFTEELNTETAYGSLSNGIKYVDDRILADGPAEIGYDGEKGVITVYEPFLAFLWCFCYLFITTRASQHLKYEISDEKRLQAIALFEYGLSLFKKWSEWDLTLPNPATYEEKECAHIEEVNTLFCFSAAFILCHEFGHHFYGLGLWMLFKQKKLGKKFDVVYV